MFHRRLHKALDRRYDLASLTSRQVSMLLHLSSPCRGLCVTTSQQLSLHIPRGKMSATAGQMYSSNMPEDFDSDLLALFVLDEIPNEVRMSQITNARSPVLTSQYDRISTSSSATTVGETPAEAAASGWLTRTTLYPTILGSQYTAQRSPSIPTGAHHSSARRCETQWIS